jgi:uncharacterized membrane protein YdcZ (DUF606 family)
MARNASRGATGFWHLSVAAFVVSVVGAVALAVRAWIVAESIPGEATVRPINHFAHVFGWWGALMIATLILAFASLGRPYRVKYIGIAVAAVLISASALFVSFATMRYVFEANSVGLKP